MSKRQPRPKKKGMSKKIDGEIGGGKPGSGFNR